MQKNTACSLAVTCKKTFFEILSSNDKLRCVFDSFLLLGDCEELLFIFK
jgi:hypothetical protein